MTFRYRLAMATAAALLAVRGAPWAAGQQQSVYEPTPNDQPQATAIADPGAGAYALPESPIVGAPAQTTIGPQQTAQPGGPPFQLTDVEQQFVMQVLKMWETESAKINTFNASFDRWEYDAVFGPGTSEPLIKSTGTLSYSKPDKGSFKIDEIKRWTKTDPQNAAPDAPGAYQAQKDEVGEHWVCDGKAVYQYNHHDKQLVVTPIPPEMRGQDIVDGPLPFLFGAKADKLMDRYWIRSNKSNAEQIFLEAHPRRQADALNYDYVEVILERKTMQPTAIQVHLPGGKQRHVYMFNAPTINGKMEAWFGNLFSARARRWAGPRSCSKTPTPRRRRKPPTRWDPSSADGLLLVCHWLCQCPAAAGGP